MLGATLGRGGLAAGGAGAGPPACAAASLVAAKEGAAAAAALECWVPLEPALLPPPVDVGDCGRVVALGFLGMVI